MTVPTLLELAALPRWVAWRTERRKGTTAVTKVPKNPHTLTDAASTRPGDWGTRAQAEDADRRLPPSDHGPGGVGLILGDWSGLAIGGVDLDACRDPATGTLEDWAQDVLFLLATYAEVSPSGTGIKAFFYLEPSAVEALRAAHVLNPDALGRSFKRGTGRDHPPAIEVHLGGRYYTVTGDCLDDYPDGPRVVKTAVLRTLLGDIGPAFAKQSAGDAKPDRSGRAFALAGRMRAEGQSFEDFKCALDGNDDLAAWKRSKGEAHGERELKRTWDRAVLSEAWSVPNLALAVADTLPAPGLPLDLFAGRWADWVMRAAQRAGSPPDYVALSLLVVVGATIGNARWASPWDGWEHPPIIWGACIGNPSAGKSPGIEAATGPLDKLAGELNDDWEERLRDHRTQAQAAKETRKRWEQDVAAAVKNGVPPPTEPIGARDPTQPRKRRVYTNDPTVEAARDMSAANPRGLLLHRDELAGWLASMGKYGNGNAGADRGFWLQSYEGKRWSSDRVKDGDDAPDVPHLTVGILGAFQPDRLASALLVGDDDGLPARFLYSWPVQSATVPPRPGRDPLPIDLIAALRRLRDLPMPEGSPVIMMFDEDAADTLNMWRQEVRDIETGATGLFLSWVGKLPGMAVRLAPIVAHLTWLCASGERPPPDRITLDDLVRVLGFLTDYAVPMARRAFGEAALPEAERDARRLARWYLRQPVPRPDVLNARDLRRMADGPGIETAARIEAAMMELTELGWVRFAPGREGTTSGRRRSDWSVNPAVRDHVP